MDCSNVKVDIVWSDDGGPIRRIINGRRDVPVGFSVPLKGGSRATPYDSSPVEKPITQLANVSSRIIRLLAQPCRVQLTFPNGEVMKYIPDLMLRVHPSFARDLERGITFTDAAVRPSHEILRLEQSKILMLELKNDKDSRDDDEYYRTKINIVRDAFADIGVSFCVIRRNVHLKSKIHINAARIMVYDQYVNLRPRDYQICASVFGGRECSSYGEISAALGEGAVGRMKLHALHCRQFVSIDLSKGLTKTNDVWLMEASE